MAEYSKLARGSFVSPGQTTVVNLPFVPDHVEVWDLTEMDHATASVPIYALWNNFMVQGDGSGYINNTVSSSVVMQTQNWSPNGIFTFSAGLAFQYGPQILVSSVTQGTLSAGTTVVTASNHNLVTGQVVVLNAMSSMKQIAGLPFVVTVTNATTFTIPWNTSQSSYATITGTSSGPFMQQILYPFLYAPGVSVINAITLGATTTIQTTTPHNMVVGQEVAFRIQGGINGWGTTELNSLPNPLIPGSPSYAYVISVPNSTSVVVNINSTNFTPFFTNMITTSVVGLSPPQILAVGDVNNGSTPYSGGSLYPSPLVNGVSTINGPGISGAFVNNTRMGFIIGSSFLPSGTSGNAIYWRAILHDYSSGVPFANNP